MVLYKANKDGQRCNCSCTNCPLKEDEFKATKVIDKKVTKAIDKVVTNNFWGFPIFILFMWVMFECTFTLGQYPMDWIDAGVDWFKGFIEANMAEGALRSLFADGIISGVGGVIIFLPNILILYFFISLMEDSGYMLRVAFIMDKIMHKMGLHGKSFIPMLMGFGCSVPAIMSAHTLESRSSRIITMLVTPFMSCGAKLPVYVIFTTLFFPKHGAIVMLSLYLIGIVVAVFSSRLLKKLFFKEDEVPFVMELPPYRVPTLKSALHHMWENSKEYLQKISTVILAASIIIWALGYFDLIIPIGRAVEPLLAPLGFDWKMSVALLTGLPAKEVIVSTLSELTMEAYTPLVAFNFMLFVLLYSPCIATLATIRHESGNIKWALFQAAYSTLLAWILCLIVYQIGILF